METRITGSVQSFSFNTRIVHLVLSLSRLDQKRYHAALPSAPTTSAAAVTFHSTERGQLVEAVSKNPSMVVATVTSAGPLLC